MSVTQKEIEGQLAVGSFNSCDGYSSTLPYQGAQSSFYIAWEFMF